MENSKKILTKSLQKHPQNGPKNSQKAEQILIKLLKKNKQTSGKNPKKIWKKKKKKP